MIRSVGQKTVKLDQRVKVDDINRMWEIPDMSDDSTGHAVIDL